MLKILNLLIMKTYHALRSTAIQAGCALILGVLAAEAQGPFRPNGRSNSKKSHKATPMPTAVRDSDFHNNGAVNDAQVALGRSLFFDKVLSGNMNISCATCHHPMAGSGDGLSLSVGEAGVGLGVTRATGDSERSVLERVPRNTPPLFNLGAKQFNTMFHDGRVQKDENFPSGFESPAGEDLPEGLETALAVQALFPPTSGTEMAGQSGDNEIGAAAADGNLAGPGGVWELLAKRLAGIDAYAEAFAEVYDDVNVPDDITMVHAANAIAAFESSAFRADNSPFDRYLRGDHEAMSRSALRGMDLFYGKAGCARCHSGKFQTDLRFRAIAMPQIGPGKGDGISKYEDFGRARVTLSDGDRFRFRTPTLRNVALTAPYGHAGAFDTLESVVRHHLDPVASLKSYDGSESTLPDDDTLNGHDMAVMEAPTAVQRIAQANQLDPTTLSDVEMRRLLDFLHSLTDRSHLDMRRLVPKRVLSEISVFD